MAFVILALGSNVGDRLAHLTQAARLLAPALQGVRISRVYESAALLPEGAPAEWNAPFLNMALAGESADSPEAWLARAKEVEKALGREARGHWGPREVDVDVIAVGDVVMQTEALTLPHAEYIKRDFVLYPVGDIAEYWKYPVEGMWHGRTAEEIIRMQGMQLGAGLQLTDFRVELP